MKKLVNSELFPVKIGPYVLDRMLSHLTSRSEYLFAIYKDKNGQKYFCKLWTGDKREQNFSWICNEIKVYETFARMYKKHAKQIKAKFPEIHIPQLLHSEISNQKVILLTEYIEGNALGSMDEKTQVITFQRIIEYFHFVSQYIRKEGKPIFHISSMYLFLLFHYYLLKVMFHCTLSFKNIFTSIKAFYSGLPAIFLNRTLSFVHRDLGFADNIIVNKNNIYLIDFQLSVLTNPYFEMANITVAQWDNKPFIKQFFKSQLMKEMLRDKKQKIQYKSFIAYAFLVSTALALDEGVFTSNFVKKTEFTHSI